MKKFASLVLSVVILATMLCVFAVPAFAEVAPKEVKPNGNGEINCNGNCIISQQGEVKAASLQVHNGSTLTIAKGTTVKVDGYEFDNNDTIIVYGTLDLSKPNKVGTNNNEEATIIVYGTLVNGEDEYTGTLLNWGKVIVVGCGGQVTGAEVAAFVGEPTEFVDHYYIDGFCACGAEDPALTASVLSDGNILIIVGVAAAVVFGLGGFILGTKKKKKPAQSNS